MTGEGPAAARLPRCAGRALVLAGAGLGLWLLGGHSSTASADELPQVPAVAGLLAPVDTVVTPVVQQVAAPVAADAAVPVLHDDVVQDDVVQDVAVPVVTAVISLP